MTACVCVMSTNDEKYERILGLLDQLRVLAEATGQKVAMLHAEEERSQVERRQKEEQEQKKEARRQRDEAARRQTVAAIETEEAARKREKTQEEHDEEILQLGLLPSNAGGK